jgi:hypothetical protein
MAESYEDRLREATVEPRALNFSALHSAAAKASTQLTADRTLTLVRLAYRREGPSESANDFNDRINADEELIGAEQKQLQALVAVESLIALFSRNVQYVGVFAALAIRCAQHAEWQPAHPDLVTHAELFLSQRAVTARSQQPVGATLAKAKPKHEPGTAERAEEEVATLREYVRLDRDRLWEREQLAWWLLSESRPLTAFGIAQSFNHALAFLPEPPSTDQMLKTKLAKVPSSTLSVAAAGIIPTGLEELCLPMSEAIKQGEEIEQIPLEISDDERSEWIYEIRKYLDQLLLIRAFETVNR